MKDVEPMSIEDLIEDRDRWRGKAERLTVALLNVRMHPEFAERIAREALEERV